MMRTTGNSRLTFPNCIDCQENTKETTMKLYFSPGACSLSPHIALLEAGLPLSLVKADTKNKSFEGGGNFLAINSKGYVPAIEIDNGQFLTERPSIAEYIADLNPEMKMAPQAS